VTDAVRSLSALALIGLLALCPLICGAGEMAHPGHGHGPPASSVPSHCPEEGDNCICQGAVRPGHVRTPDPGSEAAGLPLVPDLSVHTPLEAFAHLTCDGSPAGLAGRGGAQAVRAFLQNYRC